MASYDTTTQALGLRQYNKDVPPGWGPAQYPYTEYQDFLQVWRCLTRLEEKQIPAAIVSRLTGKTLKMALKKSIDRVNACGRLPSGVLRVFFGVLENVGGSRDVHPPWPRPTPGRFVFHDFARNRFSFVLF